jgi:hypothetical protein
MVMPDATGITVEGHEDMVDQGVMAADTAVIEGTVVIDVTLAVEDGDEETA